ncbi:MAG: nucleotidyltransferase domain-containing protein [Candidatus Freyarchaeota archaeon]|nr:nucleotidyltransferase domain-containing protein [Candidatus Jordarchaeia archaeon]
MGKKGIRIMSVKHLERVLRSSGFNIEAAYLFGSRAKGTHLDSSDWDIIIVSDDFENIPFPHRATFFVKHVPIRRADILCYTKKEFREKSKEVGFKEIVSEGIKLI